MNSLGVPKLTGSGTRVICASVLVVMLALMGCGPSRPPAFKAHGKVSFPNGSPVRVGTIEFRSREHPIHARGTIDEDGSFTLTTYRNGDGAIAGTHDCVIVQMVITEDTKAKRHGTVGVVHPRYASYSTSGLECTIEANRENLIELQVEGVGKTVQGGTEKDHKP